MTIGTTRPAAGLRGRLLLICVALVFALVLAAALFGIWTRMSAYLASFWPANALLAGFFIRYPRLLHWTTWTAAFAAYMTADLLTGGELVVTFGLTVANLAGVLTAVLLCRSWSPSQRGLAEPSDVVRLIGVGLAGAGVATLVGAPCGVAAFGLSAADATQTWFFAEVTAYMAILPAVLSSPHLRVLRRVRRPTLAELGPFLLLPVAFAVGAAIGGPTALLVLLPLLLWTAIQGRVHTTSVLAVLATGWNMIAMGSGLLDTEMDSLAATTQVSLEAGMALLAACPIVVAAAVRSREAALAQVRLLAASDPLTGLLNRRSFVDRAGTVLTEAAARTEPVSLLMLDLDHFKRINDRFGHLTGDSLLIAVSDALAAVIPRRGVLSRLGGEEFAVLISGSDHHQAVALAALLRTATATAVVRALSHAADPEAPPAVTSGPKVRDPAWAERLVPLHDWPVTASVGVHTVLPDPATTVDELIGRADALLYRAKDAGRDGVADDALTDPR